MSILIKGMEMPKSCSRCFCMASCRLWKNIMHPEFNRHRNCPLVPVTPHDCEAFEKVISERISQIEKWGEEPCNHPFEWMSILGEEFGELCEAVNETCFMNGKHPERGGDENVIREATQIAAVAMAIIRDFSPTIIPTEEGET